MTSDRKKPGVAFWATVTVVVVLAAYPLSLGPVCWLRPKCRGDHLIEVANLRIYAPDPHVHAPRIYWPIGRLAQYGPEPVRRMISGYVTAGTKRCIALPCQRTDDFGLCVMR
jgi:hypothetical protein